MNDRNEQESLEDDAELQALMELYRSLLVPSVSLLDFGRYRRMMRSAFLLQRLLSDDVPPESISVKLLPEFRMGYLTVELPELTVYRSQQFCAILSAADNFEVYPLANGNLRLDISFQNVLRSFCG